MSSNPNAELMETTYNLYDAGGRFRDNYPRHPRGQDELRPRRHDRRTTSVRVRRGREYSAHRSRRTARRRRLGTKPKNDTQGTRPGTCQSPPYSRGNYPRQCRRSPSGNAGEKRRLMNVRRVRPNVTRTGRTPGDRDRCGTSGRMVRARQTGMDQEARTRGGHRAGTRRGGHRRRDGADRLEDPAVARTQTAGNDSRYSTPKGLPSWPTAHAATLGRCTRSPRARPDREARHSSRPGGGSNGTTQSELSVVIDRGRRREIVRALDLDWLVDDTLSNCCTAQLETGARAIWIEPNPDPQERVEAEFAGCVIAASLEEAVAVIDG